MSGGVSRTERQLNLVSALLKARDGLAWPQIEVIAGYNDGLTKRSLQKRFERDLKELQGIGLLVTSELIGEGTRRYAIDRGRCLLPPLNLTPQQRILLFRVGISYLEEGGAGPLTDHLARALLKLQAGSGINALPDELPPAIVRRSLYRRPAEARHLDAIGLALLERRRICFGYEGHRREQSRRQVAPYALVARRGGWYLIAYDPERKAERTFKLSRIRGQVEFARGSKAGEFDVPDGFDSERSFSSEAFGAGMGTCKNVRVRFDADVAFIVENEFGGTYQIEPAPNGAVVLNLPQAYPSELLRYLGEFAGHWEILAPADLREQFIHRLRASLRSAP